VALPVPQQQHQQQHHQPAQLSVEGAAAGAALAGSKEGAPGAAHDADTTAAAADADTKNVAAVAADDTAAGAPAKADQMTHEEALANRAEGGDTPAPLSSPPPAAAGDTAAARIKAGSPEAQAVIGNRDKAGLGRMREAAAPTGSLSPEDPAGDAKQQQQQQQQQQQVKWSDTVAHGQYGPQQLAAGSPVVKAEPDEQL
jgi:hypothetical protein